MQRKTCKQDKERIGNTGIGQRQQVLCPKSSDPSLAVVHSSCRDLLNGAPSIQDFPIKIVLEIGPN